MSKVSIHALAFLIFFSGCSEFKTSLDMQTALDLEVGDCYIELSDNDLKPGELEDPPDFEDDPDEYWQENDYFEV